MSGTRASEEFDAATLRLAAAGDASRTGLAETVVMDRYRLGRRLGAGGFGTVFEAEDLRLGRLVALKLIHGSPGSSVRARREAMAAARLSHPGIVALFDAGEDGDTRYLVSELVPGRTLAELEADGSLSDRDVLRIGLSLADALAHAHARGVVHRDLKPQNVIVPDAGKEPDDEDGWRSAAKLADFGVASLAGDEPLTQTGDIVGTLAYMAPEQAAGGPVDARADVYALGLLLYEGLTGVNPVRAGSPAATARRLGTVLPPLCRHRRDLPADLGATIDAALDPRPERRPALAEIAEILAEGLPGVPGRGGYVAAHPLEREGRRLPRAVGRACGALGAGALAAVLLARLASVPEASVAAAAALATGLVLLLGRAGWLVAMAGTCAVIAAHSGSASKPLLLAASLAAPVVVLGGRAWAWPVPALAPLAGLVSLSLAFPALAGRAPRLWTRAVLGGLGSLWLAIGAAVLDAGLLRGSGLSPQAGGAAAGGGAGPAGAVAIDALLLHAGVWSGAAALAPVVVRGRRTTLRVAAAILWAGGLAIGTLAAAEATAAQGLDPGRVLAGAVAAAAIAAWPRR